MQSILVMCQHVIGDVLRSTFDFGDNVCGNTSDVDQPTVCVHIQYGDVLDSMFYFGDMFGSYLCFGDVQMKALAIGDVYGKHK